ncbi:hypothetical protein FJZ31_35020 [Candidatus Poribacteria bacterium]|nr:hypothetical protein [Candidatus Poribacteria bacterium]
MNFKVYLECVAFSVGLMALFVLINFPYYKMSYGEKTKQTILRTIILNCVAILIGWGPVVYYWSNFSLKFLLPAACILGALGCVGSRFIYHEILPKELAETMIELLERKIREDSVQKQD